MLTVPTLDIEKAEVWYKVVIMLYDVISGYTAWCCVHENCGRPSESARRGDALPGPRGSDPAKSDRRDIVQVRMIAQKDTGESACLRTTIH